MYQSIDCVFSDKDGSALAEYALLVGLVAVVCIGVVANLGSEISAALSSYAAVLVNI